jgi:hypothetical protein
MPVSGILVKKNKIFARQTELDCGRFGNYERRKGSLTSSH